MKRVIISGGGTGGHIFPAIAIANALRGKEKDIDILFIGATGRMEMEKVPAAGFKIEGLTISGFQRRLTWKNLTFPFKLVASLLKARSIIAKFKPDVVIGVGGYASGPTLRMATSLNIPCLIQEQNSFPGVTNRLLGSRVRKICVAYDGMEKFFPANKIVFTGNPIRQDVVKLSHSRDEALAYFGLQPGKKTLLVIGGSLGARTINQAILKFVAGGEKAAELQVLWQTGKYYYEDIRSKFGDDEEMQNVKCKLQCLVILPFVDRMDLAYTAADIIVSRAGAIAISELCVVGKPVVLVPSPNVSEDHQTKNARALVDKNAAIMIADAVAVESLGRTVTELFNNQPLQSELSRNIKSLGISDAADVIAETALSLVHIEPGTVLSNANTVNRRSETIKPSSVYLLGIGGIGMSALARFFSSQGATISGYDKTPTPLTDQLTDEGMKIHFNEDISMIPPDTEMVIYTPAIPSDHNEFRYFIEHGIRMKKRAEVLGMISSGYKTIAIAGTHGKTTTSTMVAHMLCKAGVGTLAFLGGISRNYGTNFIHEPGADRRTGGQADGSEMYCVVEADEYDKSFLQLSPFIAVITSADADHLDIYGSHDDMKNTFAEFTGKIVKGGSLVMKSGTKITPVNPAIYNSYDYAVAAESSFYAKNITVVDGLFHFDFVFPTGEITGLVLGIPGRFNLENAVAALSVGILLHIHESALREAMFTYAGVQRRFEFRLRTPDFTYIDDYAHHPEELRACISAARDLYPQKKLTGVFQPHLFSRTRDLADDFARSLELLDRLILLDIYPAREKPIPGVSSAMLLERVRLTDKKLVTKEHLIQELQENKPEVLLTLGAGDIDQFVEPITATFKEPNLR